MSTRPYTAQEKQEAIERELRFRRRVYADRVRNGKMTQQLADYQITIFEQIAADYEKQAQGERLI